VRQDLKSRVIPGQTDVFFYFSGHGAPNADTKEGYLIPWDYDPRYIPSTDSAYSLNELYTDLGRLGVRSVTIMLEACFSGVSEGGVLAKDASSLNITVENPALLLTNGLVITAGGSREIASWYQDRKHGLMTYYWLRAMRGEAGDSQGRVTPEGLKHYLQERVPPMAQQLRGRNQTPDVIANTSDRVIVQLPVSALASGKAKLLEAYGKLQVTIDRGGDLTIDGVHQGNVPAGRIFSDDQIAAGPHQIEIRRDGYEIIRDEVLVDADQLVRKTYRLTTNAQPPSGPPPTLAPSNTPGAAAPKPSPELTPSRPKATDVRDKNSALGTIWLYNTRSNFFSNRWTDPTLSFCESERLAKIGKNEFFSVSVPPGTYCFNIDSPSAARSAVTVTVRPGDEIFVHFSFTQSLVTVSLKEANKDFADNKIRPVDPKNIFNPSVTTRYPF